jgi:hypothetical protein
MRQAAALFMLLSAGALALFFFLMASSGRLRIDYLLLGGIFLLLALRLSQSSNKRQP